MFHGLGLKASKRPHQEPHAIGLRLLVLLLDENLNSMCLRVCVHNIVHVTYTIYLSIYLSSYLFNFSFHIRYIPRIRTAPES